MDTVPIPPTRLPRFRRNRWVKPTFVLTDRDRAILTMVADYRLMTSEQIQRLVGGSGQNVLRRLQVLYHGGYLDRPRSQRQFHNVKLVYALGALGATELATRDGVSRVSRDWTEKNRQIQVPYIEHALMISNFRAALTLATRETDIEIERWNQGQETRDYVMVNHADWIERLPVCPDAHCVLRLKSEPEGHNRIHALVECDRSTMTVKRFIAKLRGYWEYRCSGRQEQRYGMKNFLVVTVTRTPERAKNLIEAAAALDMPKAALRMFVFASEQEYSLAEPHGIMAPVWHTPTDNMGHRLVE
jgi:hypothetical protein